MLKKAMIDCYESGLDIFEKRMATSAGRIRAEIESCWKVIEVGRDTTLLPEASKGGKFEEMSREIKELKACWKWTIPPVVTKGWTGSEGRKQ